MLFLHIFLALLASKLNINAVRGENLIMEGQRDEVKQLSASVNPDNQALSKDKFLFARALDFIVLISAFAFGDKIL
jgi:hypothetical protein